MRQREVQVDAPIPRMSLTAPVGVDLGNSPTNGYGGRVYRLLYNEDYGQRVFTRTTDNNRTRCTSDNYS